jgi:hypothetical protein
LRVRDHIALSTAAATLLFPLFGKRVAPAWAASILIDSDHYLWFVANERRLDPVAALHFFNEAQPPPASSVRWFHSPVALAIAAAASAKRRSLLAVALGMAAHVALDVYHESRMKRVQAAALRRDDYRCQECGATDETVTVHTRSQPMVLPSYKVGNFVALCGPCHVAAHKGHKRRQSQMQVAGRGA